MTQAKYDFAVVVALSEEAQYFRDFVACGDPFQMVGYTAWPIVEESWDAYGKGVLVMSGDMGVDRARTSTAAVVAEMKVRLVANIGIAGRIADWLSIGDVVVPREVLDFCTGGKIAGDPAHTLYKHRPKSKPVTSSLVGLAETHLQKDSRLMASINQDLKSRFSNPALWPNGPIKLVVAPLACTPFVVANEEFRKSFAEAHRDAAALEMESAGVMTALEGTGVEFVSVRGISDGADFHKAELELNFNDENRRFALVSACSALEAMLILRVDQKEAQSPGAGIYVYQPDQPLPASILDEMDSYESLFSKLVQGPACEFVPNPIASISRHLRSSDYREPVVLLGGKGAGKTTLLGMIQAEASQSTQDDQAISGCLSILIKIGDLEAWRNGVLDDKRTRSRVDSACQRLRNIMSTALDPTIVLVDGLSQAASHRTSHVAALIRETSRHKNARLLVATESEIEFRSLYSWFPLQSETAYSIVPLEIDHEDAATLIEDFAKVKGEESSGRIFEDMKRKDVRSIDLFILSLFFGPFGKFAYKGLTSLAQCYDLYCKSALARDGDREIAAEVSLKAAAQIAYGIMITRNVEFAHLNERNVAKLVASHSSIMSYLVALHIVNVLRGAKKLDTRTRGKPQDVGRQVNQELGRQINYVFPADVNSFTKQIIQADRDTEREVIEVIKQRHRSIPTLAKSHFAYLAGRVREDRAAEMLQLLDKIETDAGRPMAPLSIHARMLRRSIFISRSMLSKTIEPAIQYANILLSDVEESEFNRGFHLEYYGDKEYEPSSFMTSQDNGTSSCNKTVAKLLERITAKPRDLPPLIELLTLLSLVQVRNLNGTLRNSHRAAVKALLRGPQLREIHLLPPNIRGFIERVGEDLEMDGFRLSTVREEWSALSKIERTGWLRRRRDALGDHAAFWQDVRIESVAEHLVGVLGLAEIFLVTNPPEGPEKYDKRRVIEMILVHDLAESRLGDQLPKYNDAKQEEVALWKYGAFATYRGIGDLWRVPILLQEFNKGETDSAKVAKDLDRLQFILQARAYAAGMSEDELAACENASHNILTSTVRAIEKIVAGPLPPARFQTPPTKLD